MFSESKLIHNCIVSHRVVRKVVSKPMMIRRIVSIVALMFTLGVPTPAGQQQAVPSPEFEFFKSRVEPIFLKKRPGHARCYFCHVVGSGANAAGTAFHLEKLSPGSTFWSEEQSRRNFEVVSRLVTPGEPLSSYLLKHPLARDAGGDISHGGGRQFASQNDPDWLTLAEWVRGRKADGASDK
jgi:hypothetical protein